MRSNYKRLGDYIKEVKERNTDLAATELLGVNIDKFFMPSVANIVGTDMSVYKIVKRGQFACNRMHVGRDMRLPVALSDRDYEFMVSPAYDVFEIKDTAKLLPEYLMMWFTRKEFDREACFYTDADVRGGLNWKALCDMQLPVPSPEKQRQLVNEYHVLVDRITINNRLIQKLEETAQAVYKEWFVDFEFPDASPIDGATPSRTLNNKIPGYKSSGGEMVESEMGMIPKGWSFKQISSICDITSSKRIFEYEYTTEGIPFYRGKEITLKKAGAVISEPIFISKERYNGIVKSFGKPNEGDILMTAVGTIGSTYMVQNEEFYFKDGNVIWFKNFFKKGSNFYLYDFMQSEKFNSIIDEITIGSTQNAITIATFGQQKIVFPDENILKDYVNKSSKLNIALSKKKLQLLSLSSLQSLLLSKLATIK